MSVFKVASRYAKSLLDLASEQGSLETIKTDMESFIAVLKSSSELQAILANPIVPLDKKKSVLDALFKDKINPTILAFFKIMINKGRGVIVYATAQEFIREYNEVKGIVKATVTSAAPLSEANLTAMKDVLAKETNAQVILTNKVDSRLIGGFVVNIGDRQIDASIAGKLNKLERYLNQGN
ncbi:F0F1 ATP synthase subunit delta [Sphingobacterium thalpophilum]|uniref:ATP synthase subunit delta n=1 Tax=Sphingobacterium thalpophilum TaxID=259 RepID=A0A4V6Z2R3_9SPHI|nr:MULTISPECIES: F0F1 ATP synthase subunit delta [Sphingobacterium]MCW8312689.1 F0F1 ATP synthase subunit delta [Sphingobacterium sp. InxBP1]VTR40628.1 F-type ATPase subunit delta [Sphingobacterium thalpophilum]